MRFDDKTRRVLTLLSTCVMQVVCGSVILVLASEGKGAGQSEIYATLSLRPQQSAVVPKAFLAQVLSD